MNLSAKAAAAALFWVVSLYPAWHFRGLFLFAFTPLVGMVCDSPRVSCGQTLLQIYGLVLVSVVDIVVFLYALFTGLARSIRTALLFATATWSMQLWTVTSVFFQS